jgi:hypothetical protein
MTAGTACGTTPPQGGTTPPKAVQTPSSERTMKQNNCFERNFAIFHWSSSLLLSVMIVFRIIK